jgi:RNA polymerase sigma factor (sigma-70 family)
MKISVPDAKIKKSLRFYQRGDETKLHDILTLLSPYIYHYPRIVFHTDGDRCGDFYVYMLGRLNGILHSYHETDAKFLTWFTVVLRNRYLNFVRERKNTNIPGDDCPFISLDSEVRNAQSLHNCIADNRDYLGSEQELYDLLIERISAALNPRRRLFFHLYYIESLRPEDVGFISITLNRTIKETLYGISRLKESALRRYERKQQSLDKLNVLFRDIVRSQKDGDAEETAKLRKRRDRLLEEYRRIKIHPSYEGLAGFLELPMGTISTNVSRMKRDVRAILEDVCHEKLPL